ncbi:hypothetical protein BDK88_3456 [Natrinema hispanicum]|uniref:Uncharacterized protein n=1 Tax=Natrinema hispanicum TaxID=392421 RepID=A0A482Y997_9EURY|nr:hypothetical protein BDK88_3456 [Natrinema hispanicum]
MTVIGMPVSMFIVFVATLVAGSLGAIHYVVVHVLLGRPVNDVTTDQTIDGSEAVADRGRTDG